MNVLYSEGSRRRKQAHYELVNRADPAIHGRSESVCAERGKFRQTAFQSRLIHTSVFLTGYPMIMGGFSSIGSARSSSTVFFFLFKVTIMALDWLQLNFAAVGWICSRLLSGGLWSFVCDPFWVSFKSFVRFGKNLTSLVKTVVHLVRPLGC